MLLLLCEKKKKHTCSKMNNPEQQAVYGIAAEYRNIRRLWLQYIFTTAVLIIILLFACTLAMLIAFIPEMIPDFVVSSIITAILIAAMMAHAKYTQADMTVDDPQAIMTLLDVIIYFGWCTVAIVTSIIAGIRNPSIPWVILIVLYCNCFAYAMFEELATFAQQLYGDRTVVFAMRNYQTKAAMLASKVAIIFLAIFPIVQLNR